MNHCLSPIIAFLFFFSILTAPFAAAEASDKTELLGVAHAADELTGRVIDVFGEGIATIQVEGGHSFQPGDRVDLTYMAGMLPMAIGVFEVRTVKGNVFIAHPVSKNMELLRDMKLQIALKRKGPQKSPATQVIQVEKPADTGLNVSGAGDDLKAIANVGKPSPMQGNSGLSGEVATGKVTEVLGDDIVVSLDAGKESNIQPGRTIELFYVTASGRELPVGKWKVVSLFGESVKGSRLEGVGNPRVGLKAVINPEKSGDSPAPSPESEAASQTLMNSSREGTLFDPNYSPKKPLPDGEVPNWWIGLGIQASSAPPDLFNPAGVNVVEVGPGSPAEIAGIKVGDHISHADNTQVIDPQHFVLLVRTSATGKMVLRVIRQQKTLDIPVQLQNRR